MLRIQVIPRDNESIYRLLRQKIDTGAARTFYWADKKRRRLKHRQPSHPGQIVISDASPVLVADARGDQIVGAFVARLAAWFPEEIAAINMQMYVDDSGKKRTKR